MIREKIRKLVEEILDKKWGIKEINFYVEKPKKETFGDYSTNVAFSLAKFLKRAPLQIAEELKEELKKWENFEKLEVAGGGFINFFIKKDYFIKNLIHIFSVQERYGECEIGKGIKILLEFVSANPTGPLHIGHGRGAALGDSLARVLKKAGYEVTTEYYINDKGTQMQILGESVYLRIRELKGEKIDFPEDYYRGEYIYDIAKKILKEKPEILTLDKEEAIEFCRDFALQEILEGIKRDLEDFRVHFDNWFSERSLYESGIVEETLKFLRDRGYLYEKEGALWFKSSEFGDEKDRVIRRSNGEFTYFAGDIAYHYEKFIIRKFDRGINIWGADHHGYVKRMKGALKALGVEPERLEIILIQMVNLIEGGERKSMSTRAGEFITLRELLDKVGPDPMRFIFLSRTPDATIEFDVDLAQKQTSENPVYYVQYAHARICSLFEKAKERGISFDLNIIEEDLLKSFLELPEEIEILKLLEFFQEVIFESAAKLSPHRIYYYLLELARTFHEYYTKVRILDEGEKTIARLALCKGCQIVLKEGLNLLGVSAPEKM